MEEIERGGGGAALGVGERVGAGAAILPRRFLRALGGTGNGAAIVEQRLITDELVTVLLQDRGGAGFAAHDEHGLAVLLQLVHERNKIAVAADDGEGVHVAMGKRHLQRIERQVDIGSVLISARRWQPLHHLHRVFRHAAGGAFLASPVGIGEFGDYVAALLERLNGYGDVEFAPQRGLYADLYVVVVDKDGHAQFFLHSFSWAGTWPAISFIHYARAVTNFSAGVRLPAPTRSV